MKAVGHMRQQQNRCEVSYHVGFMRGADFVLSRWIFQMSTICCLYVACFSWANCFTALCVFVVPAAQWLMDGWSWVAVLHCQQKVLQLKVFLPIGIDAFSCFLVENVILQYGLRSVWSSDLLKELKQRRLWRYCTICLVLQQCSPLCLLARFLGILEVLVEN